MEAEGPQALDTAIRAAWWRTEYASLLEQHENPKLSRQQADAMLRSQWLFPPPESMTTTQEAPAGAGAKRTAEGRPEDRLRE